MAPQSTAMAPQSAAMQLELFGIRAKDTAQKRTEAKQDEIAPLVAMPSLISGIDGSRELREVWAWNLDEEFDALLAAVAGEAGVILALDMEFPGFVYVEPPGGNIGVRYQALRENVDSLRPIQLGLAVASAEGILRGVWSFNLSFDVDVDLHTEQSVAFLRAAGINFPRHASEGIDAEVLGRRLAGSYLVGHHGRSPCWVTFSGAYDLGYLLKLITNGQPLPQEPSAFDSVLSVFCPTRHELRDHLAHGSLDKLARQHGVKRHGQAHTAGSDALLTLELFLCVKGLRRWNPWADDAWGGADSNGTDAASLYSQMESWYGAGWENGWGASRMWEEQYNPFLFAHAAGSPWASQMLPGAGPTSYMGQGFQTAPLKGNATWPDAATAAALLKSGSWHPPDSTAVSSQVLAI
jgi:CCR4-NOT transcription complex subunit 7/8